MNVIARLKFEIAYYDVAVEQVKHNGTRTPSTHNAWLCTVYNSQVNIKYPDLQSIRRFYFHDDDRCNIHATALWQKDR